MRFIDDPTQRKDLRHIQPMLAEPGLFTVRGLQLIVLEDNGDESVTVKCPTFGVSMDRNKRNDFAFISRSLKNIGATENKYARYELYLHTANKPAKGGEGEIHETIIRWDYNSRRYWPEIVQRRVDEYMTQCQSRYRSLYTSQEGVNSLAMIPLSKAVDAAPFRPEGIIKDSYNHIVGLTFRSKAGSSTLVGLPVVDDGVISISSAFSIKSIYLDWEDFKAAPVDEVVNYYRRNLEPLFSLYPGYIIKYIAKQKADGRIVAVQLENGIYIPVAPPKDEASLSALGLDSVKVDQFQWVIDKLIAGQPSRAKANASNDWVNVLEKTRTEKGCGFDSELMRKSSYVQFEELYQQFRLMVSNWLVSAKAGSGVRKSVEEIIFNSDLPEYERRKRLYIFISSSLLSWFYPDEEKWEAPVSFLRKDCRVIDSPEACTGTCFWKEDESKCLLHVDATTEIGEREVSTPELFTKRVIDELVRFPAKRKQLMKRGEISRVSTIVQAVRQGDQYIIPESSPTWTNLLRLDWARQVPEEPKYYEEMSREAPETLSPVSAISTDTAIPASLQAILGRDTRFKLKVPDIKDRTQPLAPFTAILGVTLGQLGLEDTATGMTRDNLIKYVSLTSKPIGVINIVSAPTAAGAGAVAENIDTYEAEFIRPFSGSFDAVTILVFLPDQIGLLMEEDGDPTVKISALPEALQKKWRTASLVQKKPAVAREPTVVDNAPKPPILIGRNPIIKPKRRPLVANTVSAPFVEREKVANTIKPKATRRKPRVANNVSAPLVEREKVANTTKSQSTLRKPKVANA
jgi:hypothetical protein